MTNRTLNRVSAALMLAAAAGTSHAQCLGQQLIADTLQTNAFNGGSVAIDGPYVMLGADGRNTAQGAAAGEVYCYAPFGGLWGQAAHITAPDGAANAYFGSSVSMGGSHTWAIVGALGANNNAGAAYIFKRDVNTNLWNFNSKVVTGSTPGEKYGWSVAMNKQGTVAVASSPNAAVTDLFGTTTGAGTALVYVRTNNTWNYEMDLHQYDASVRHTNDSYGYSVAADGSNVVVGCRNGDISGKTDCGFIHVWTRDNLGWSGIGEIVAPDAAPSDYFGSAVSISGDTIAVGAPGAAANGLAGAGAVYLLKLVNGNWILDGKITATDNFPGLAFGSAVSVSPTRVVVGTGDTKQRTYVFRRLAAGQWIQDARYNNPLSGAAGDAFGCSVALDGTTFVSGAWGFDTANFQQTGTAYVFDLPTDGSDTCDGATPVSQGTYTGCNLNASIDGYSTCGSNGLDLWYRYTAPATGSVTIDTQGSALDTVLSVHSGCPAGQFNTVACNDDFAAPQRWSKVTVNVAQGQSYLIRVAGYNNATNDFTLNIGQVITCYPNCDNSSSAPILNVADFTCFLQHYAANDPWANCDGSVNQPVLNVADFTCFLQKFAAGCE